jgi:NADPH:quinone reductase-like Zn-dependent oxidoreductase
VLVNIKAAALNARDLMVVAHDPIYHIGTVEGLSPCSDGAGVIAKIGERERGKEPGCWKVGDRVVLCANLGWKYKEWPVLAELKGRGAGDVIGTLRE